PGGCTLVNPFPSGDPGNFYQVWVNLVPPDSDGNTPPTMILKPGTTTIPVDTNTGVFNQFPPRGFALINDPASPEYIYFETNATSTAPPSQPMLINVQRSQLGTTAVVHNPKYTGTVIPIPIILVSAELSSNPTGLYQTSGDCLVQLYD